MKQSKFPPGCRNRLMSGRSSNSGRGRRQDEAAYEDSTQAIMEVPRELVPTIRNWSPAQTVS